MAKKKQIKPVEIATNGKPLDDQSVALAKFATIAYIDADEWGIKDKTIEQSPLDGDERATLAALPIIPAVFKKKLGKKTALTVVDVISLVVVISESLGEAEAGQQAALLIKVSIVAGDDIDGYDSSQDTDLYAYYIDEAESSSAEGAF
jgi:hypothetical protein